MHHFQSNKGTLGIADLVMDFQTDYLHCQLHLQYLHHPMFLSNHFFSLVLVKKSSELGGKSKLSNENIPLVFKFHSFEFGGR